MNSRIANPFMHFTTLCMKELIIHFISSKNNRNYYFEMHVPVYYYGLFA